MKRDTVVLIYKEKIFICKSDQPLWCEVYYCHCVSQFSKIVLGVPEDFIYICIRNGHDQLCGEKRQTGQFCSTLLWTDLQPHCSISHTQCIFSISCRFVINAPIMIILSAFAYNVIGTRNRSCVSIRERNNSRIQLWCLNFSHFNVSHIVYHLH